MAVSNLGKLLELVEEVLDIVPIVRKSSAKLSEQRILDNRIIALNQKIWELKQTEEFK